MIDKICKKAKVRDEFLYIVMTKIESIPFNITNSVLDIEYFGIIYNDLVNIGGVYIYIIKVSEEYIAGPMV